MSLPLIRHLIDTLAALLNLASRFLFWIVIPHAS